MTLLRRLARLRPPMPTPDALAALAHLIVLGLALALVARGEGTLAALPAAVVTGPVG